MSRAYYLLGLAFLLAHANAQSPAQCHGDTSIMFGCLTSLMDTAVLSRLKEFQGISPLMLVTETPQQVRAHINLATDICRNLLLSKTCAAKGQGSPLAWWSCDRLLDEAAAQLLNFKNFFTIEGMPEIGAEQIKYVLEMSDNLCFSPTGIRALVRNQQCLTTAMRQPDIEPRVKDLVRIFGPGYHFKMEECTKLQNGTFQVVNAINNTCVAARLETTTLTTSVFKAAMGLVLDYDGTKCPMFTNPATTSTTSTTTTTRRRVTPRSTTTTTTTAPPTNNCHYEDGVGRVCDYDSSEQK